MAAAQLGLDQRVIAAGAPMNLPRELQGPWLEWHEAKGPPVFVIAVGDRKLVLEPKTTRLATYAPFIEMRVEDSELHAVCIIQGCDSKAATTGTRITYDNKVQMANFLEHLWRAHGGWLLTAADFKEKAAAAAAAAVVKKKRKAGGEVGGDAEAPVQVFAAVKSDFIKHLARWLIMDTLPWTVVQGMGFRQLCAEKGLPIVGRTAVSDAYKKMYEVEVLGPLKACLAAWKTPVAFNINGDNFLVKVPVFLGIDGWEARNGNHFVSLILHGRQQFQGMLKREQALLGLRHWVPDKAGGKAAQYSADQLVEFVKEQLAVHGVDVEKDVLGIEADTASTNRKTAELLDCEFLGCWQHVLDLCCEDMMKCAAFAKAHQAYSDMTVFLRGSDKRTTALMAAQEALHVPKAKQVVPIRPSATRFNSSFLTSHRILRLRPALTSMWQALQVPQQDTFNAEDKSEFCSIYAKLLATNDELELISSLSGPILKISSALGSTTNYVLSCQRPLLMQLVNAIAAERNKGPKASCISILDAFHCSVYERLAPVVFWEVQPPAGFVEPKGNRREQCIARDDIANATAVLDPACFPTLLHYSNNTGHAVAFYYNKIITPNTRIVDPQGAPVDKAAQAAAGSKAKAALEKKKIREEPKPSPFMTDDVWEEEKQRRMDEVDARFGAAAAGGAQAVAALDPLGPLLTQLEAEMATLKKLHVEAREQGLEWVKRYGLPFDQGNANRLMFWPTQKSNLPLLYTMASVLLTAPAASTDNERAHSLGGRIVSKLRSSMTGASVDRNTMGYVWLRKKAASLAEQLNAKGVSHDDVDDNLEHEGEEEAEAEEEEEIILVEDEGAAGGGGGNAAMGGGAAGGGAKKKGGGGGREEEEEGEE